MLLDGATAMSSVVTALQSILTTDAMFANLASLIPVVGGVLVFAFTYRIVRKIICETIEVVCLSV